MSWGEVRRRAAGGADTGVAMSPVEKTGATLPLTLGAVGAVAVGAVMLARSRTRTA
ncbi:hypothetical protein IWX64_002025 [Arthrobacter sp. CAN_A212]|uniref:hypothetical protein n=1 Tax=unclassified Arthrobacter TaxID=235627 RepID=UPI0018C9D7B7|nr:hypothetical protein [Arthrobacter sp. CAN_C5]MBP2214941.1 hypothetical protein [Arthrobacter sp. CAN_C5]